MRLYTREKDNFECRIKEACPAEEWMETVTGYEYWKWKEDEYCKSCPFEKYINKLAEYEDNE